MSSLGNFTAPSLSRLFTRKDHVQYTPGHYGDAAYLVNRFGARHGEILVPETWQGNFDGSDSTSDPVTWYQVDEFTMDFVVDREDVNVEPTTLNTMQYRFPYILTYSSPGRTTITQTGESASYSGKSYNAGTNRLEYTDIIVGWPISSWLLTPATCQVGRNFNVTGFPAVTFSPTITPDPPTENWVARKGKYEVDVYMEWGGSIWGDAGHATNPKNIGIITRTNRIIPVTNYQEIYAVSQSTGTSANLSWTLPALTANPLWNLFFKCTERIDGNLVGSLGDRIMRFTVDFTRV